MAGNPVNDLNQIQRDLQFAATSGAARLAQGVVKQARTDAEVNVALSADGPGLTQLLRRSGQASTTTEAEVDVPKAAAEMAEGLADGGAALALGRRR